jgi:PIN domain nuclease of toxin-antitoxin system
MADRLLLDTHALIWALADPVNWKHQRRTCWQQ